MASTSSGSSTGHYGGRRSNCGRKKIYDSGSSRKGGWEKCRRRIRLEENIYKSWLEAKFEAGYDSLSDSDFAAHLLSNRISQKVGFRLLISHFFATLFFTKCL